MLFFKLILFDLEVQLLPELLLLFRRDELLEAGQIHLFVLPLVLKGHSHVVFFHGAFVEVALPSLAVFAVNSSLGIEFRIHREVVSLVFELLKFAGDFQHDYLDVLVRFHLE